MTECNKGTTKSKFNMGRKAEIYLSALFFLLPALVLYIVFIALPIIMGLVLAFFKWNVIESPKMVGLHNFSKLITDPEIINSFRVTLMYILEVLPVSILLGFALAVILNIKMRGMAIIKLPYFFPIITSLVCVATIWIWIYEPQFGIANYLIGFLGISPKDWLDHPRIALQSLSIMTIWRILPLNILFYIAALQQVPSTLYESAKLDGANFYKMMFHITWPMVTPTTFFLVITTTVYTLFHSFPLISVMTRGGPFGATDIIGYRVFTTAFNELKMGYASAIGAVLFIIMMVLTALYFVGQRRWVHYN